MRVILGVLFLFASAAHAGERIISAGAGVTGLVQALGGQSQLVAVDSSSHLPAEAKLPVVGYHRQLAGEGLLALKPTLLLGSEEMGPETTLQQLSRAGVKVERLSITPDLATLQHNIQRVGELLGKQEAATRLSAHVTQQVAALAKDAGQLSRPPRLVYLLVVPGRPPMVAGSNTPADTLIRLAGAENPAHHLRNYPQLNAEALMAMQPDGLVVSERSLQQDPQLIAHTLPQLAASPAFNKLPVYSIAGAALIGGMNLSTLQAAQTLQQQLLHAGAAAGKAP